MEVLAFAMLWIIWCILHSVLISVTVSDYLKRRLGTGFRFYRLFFNIIALVTIIPLLMWEPTEPFFYWDSYAVIGKIALCVVGAFLMVAGSLQYDLLGYMGIRQIKEKTSHTLMSDSGELNSRGILGIIRHPWYLAGIILVWASDLGASEIIRNVILDCYLVIGAYIEERKLVAKLGEKYREYQRQVPMLFPCKWPKRS